jgi:hypothetical protein
MTRQPYSTANTGIDLVEADSSNNHTWTAKMLMKTNQADSTVTHSGPEAVTGGATGSTTTTTTTVTTKITGLWTSKLPQCQEAIASTRACVLHYACVWQYATCEKGCKVQSTRTLSSTRNP